MTTFSGTVPLSSITDFQSGGFFEKITFESSDRQDSIPYLGGNIHTEFVVFNTELDFRFLPPPTTTGIAVVEIDFDINFSFDVPERLNLRIFPVDVGSATLFPGDVPRGDPLN